ncbi:MAG TPA: discoidin domain-containing protein [Candidatus Limnocylindrales bacterium]|nr:discoidin domain-containing protein [Candidatus Limnocylindrales bacterium]
MTFDTVVFGSFKVGTGYTDGSTITGGGLRLFIKPTKNIGFAPLDVTVTYVDQFGNTAETTIVSTSVPGSTTSGAHIQVSLNAGDSGVQDVTNITVVGGTAGDEFNVESWNEGLGKTPFSLGKSDADFVWEDTEPTKDTYHLEQSWVKDEEMDITTVNVIQGGTVSDKNFTVETETFVPDYETDFSRYGFLDASTTNIQDNGMKRLMSSLGTGLSVTKVDVNEHATRYKWKYNGSGFDDSGFIQIDFDFALVRGSLFTFEVIDQAGVVKLTRAANTKGWTASPTINSYCGQETSYPASNSRDGNTATEWRHHVNELHWIIYDLGAGAVVGGLKIFWRGLASGYICDVSSSNNLTDWIYEVMDWDISGAAGVWKEQQFIPVQKRYIKIEIDPYNTSNDLDDFMETQFYLFEHQALVFKSLGFEMRLRCSTSGTSAGTEYVDIRNITLTRYKPEGSVTSNMAVSLPGIDHYDEVLVGATTPAGTSVRAQLAFSDNGSDWSDYCGPDGTDSTFYDYIGQAILLPGGYTGYYYKWKAILYSDGRETPIFDTMTIWEFVKILPRELVFEKQLSDLLFEANPVMVVPIGINREIPRNTPGYPTVPAGGNFVSEGESGNDYALLAFNMIVGADETWIPDCISGRSFNRRLLLFIKTYSETTVGQVLSGYVRDQHENIITGTKIIITSTYSVGLDQMGTVNPETGFYQVFVKPTKYEGRSVIVGVAGKSFSVSYAKYGTPDLLDGTTTVASPQDLHFWKPDAICGKSVAFVGSLVTY